MTKKSTGRGEREREGGWGKEAHGRRGDGRMNGILVDLERYRERERAKSSSICVNFQDGEGVRPWKLLKLGDYLSLSLVYSFMLSFFLSFFLSCLACSNFQVQRLKGLYT